MEMLEHVRTPQTVVDSCHALLKPGGLFVASTVNRTPLSYVLGIAVAEYVLGMTPVGTHDHAKFITPDECRLMLDRAGFARETTMFNGMFYRPLGRDWVLTDDERDARLHALAMQVNFIFASRKSVDADDAHVTTVLGEHSDASRTSPSPA